MAGRYQSGDGEMITVTVEGKDEVFALSKSRRRTWFPTFNSLDEVKSPHEQRNFGCS